MLIVLNELYKSAYKNNLFLRCPLLQELTFYLTPGVVPSTKTLTEMIRSAGGRTVPKRPSIAFIRRQQTSQVCCPPFLWVTTFGKFENTSWYHN